jgi:hypothetical protein
MTRSADSHLSSRSMGGIHLKPIETSELWLLITKLVNLSTNTDSCRFDSYRRRSPEQNQIQKFVDV